MLVSGKKIFTGRVYLDITVEIIVKNESEERK